MYLYYSFAYPHLKYAITLWGSACKSFLEKIQVMQNNCIIQIINFKFIRNKVKMCTLYKSMKILKVKTFMNWKLQNLCTLFIITCFLKILRITSKLLSIIMIITLGPLLKTTSMRTNTPNGQQCFSYSGVKIWNKIPINLKHLNRFLFSKNIKKSMIGNY